MATSDVIVVALAILGVPFCVMAAHAAWGHGKLRLLGFFWAVLAVAFAAMLAAIILGVQP